MCWFIGGILLLVLGYLFYGKLVEKIVGADNRLTPADRISDGVDYIQLPHWKNMLIQLLNIAGVGPVIGVIIGIKFGTITFLIIPIGCIFAGAVHDYMSGMMSLRANGSNLPALVKNNLGSAYASFFAVFMSLLLILVVAVFINIPANLLTGMFERNVTANLDHSLLFWSFVTVIFIYYICATLFPVDKIIGKIYPFFGGLLIICSALLMVMLIIAGVKNPALLTESAAFKSGMFTQPIIPCLFVTIACGIISGFHATQSPIIARTMSSEKQARAAFYGMMIVEGVIAMIWAAGALAIYNLLPEMLQQNPNNVLLKITTKFLGEFMGGLTVLGVVILAITSGDTAMRSLRLSCSEILKIEQKQISKRILLCLPLIVIVSGILIWSNQNAASFSKLWSYFAWGNQVLAATTLLTATTWLVARKKFALITIIPAAFMIMIIISYILWASNTRGAGTPAGFGLNYNISIISGVAVAAAGCIWAYLRGLKQRGKVGDLAEYTPDETKKDQ